MHNINFLRSLRYRTISVYFIFLLVPLFLSFCWAWIVWWCTYMRVCVYERDDDVLIMHILLLLFGFYTAGKMNVTEAANKKTTGGIKFCGRIVTLTLIYCIFHSVFFSPPIVHVHTYHSEQIACNSYKWLLTMYTQLYITTHQTHYSDVLVIIG